MGTYYTHGASKHDIIQEVTEPYKGANEDGSIFEKEVLAKSVRGNVLWTVEQVKQNGETHSTFIGCYLLSKAPEGWGYKPLDESAHPYYYTCPLKFLSMAPVACQKWRDIVLKEAGRKSVKLKVGDTVKLRSNTAKLTEAQIESVRPLRIRTPGGIFKISRKLIDDSPVQEISE